MKRVHPSGAQKRKIAAEKIASSVKSARTLSSWVQGGSLSGKTSIPSSSSTHSTNMESSNLSSFSKETEEHTQIQPVHEDVVRTTPINSLPAKSIEVDEPFPLIIPVPSSTEEINLNLPFPTDRGHFEETITNCNLKRIILSYGPCRPESIHFPRNDITNRRFSPDYYFMSTKSGARIPRLWLCYSVCLDKVYCESCWLFSDRSEKNFKREWTLGINDWRHLSQKIEVHEKSVSHLVAMKVRSLWRKNETCDNTLEKQISEEAKFWREVLRRIIKVILSLTAGNAALRGNEGKGDSEFSEGNFLRSIRLIAEFDPIMYKLLADEKKKIKYLSPNIQNELIDILATNLRTIICNDIRKSYCFSIIVDSTLDITKTDQVSVIIRYVSLNYQEASIAVKESFLGFFALKEHGAQNYQELICDVLNKHDIEISKCRGQGYDGASVMSGSYSGLQKRIQDIAPNAVYVHCCSHNLNLVISDAAKSSSHVVNFFATVQDVFLFFSLSAPRWSLLAIGEHMSHKIKKRTLKKICPTRWEARYEAIYCLKERFVDVLKSLTKIQLTSKKNDERMSANSLKKKLESMEFVVMIIIWEKILRSLQGVSKVLQKINMELPTASRLLNQAVVSLTEFREEYDKVIHSAIELCSKWGIPSTFSSKRRRFTTVYLDEIDGDRRLDVTEKNFRFKIFYPIIDTVTSQLKSRFKGIETVLTNFNFLNPEVILKMSDKDLIKSAEEFAVTYDSDISSDFPMQMISFKESAKLDLCNLKTINEMASLILQNGYSSSYPDLIVACVIFLTIPVTVATAERSFSKLKLIKNYLRNSSTQQRLTNIAILNIERARSKEIDVDSIITTFANVKARRKNFFK